MTLSPVARGAKAAIDAEWLNHPPYDLAAQAVAVLIREGRLVGAAGAAELARLESLMNAQPAELTEQQIDALAEAGNRVVNDANHTDQCMCDAWPKSCPHYPDGTWDMGALDAAIPAVVGLWEVMRAAGDAGEVGRLRTRVAELLAERHTTNRALADLTVAVQAKAEHSVYLAEDALLGRSLGIYTSREPARDHCQHRASTEPKLREMTIGAWRWRLPRPDAVAEELYAVADGGTEHRTGYAVTPIAVASAYDKEAAESADRLRALIAPSEAGVRP